MADLIKTCDIKPGYRSDHSIITMDIILSNFNHGKGTWKFNNSLLHNQDYLNLVNKIIQEEVLKYAVPVYSIQHIKENPDSISLILDDELFLEVLLLRIWGETIKFASHLKKEVDKNEKQLLKDIETLESDNDLLTANLQLLLDKKKELQVIRENKIKGQQVRSKLQWLKEGEKPTKYFCNLENKNFIEKTVKKLQNEKGQFLTEQKEILRTIRNYYASLFQNRDNVLDEVNLQKVLHNIKINKVSDSSLENTINVDELGEVLKSMKNNKSPGIDGITAEFLKVFWRQLKIFICKALNSCFTKGQLSTSLCQGIIICIPKGKKDRSLMKNWRPITLLNIIYKLASGVIAQRLKKPLPMIISKTQTGFISGRMISDNTRLIYDIMHIAESKNLTGLLMLVDFEKAFDSISWKFIYKTLQFFGYSSNFIRWIQLFNTDIKLYVLQCGYLSEFIPIGRGCRQGDPISPYLFLIVAEILALLIKINPEIIGITINGKEFKLTQFADDTTLLLDGSECSLQSALNTLEIFGTFSGLKINKEKTKIVWIGKNRNSKIKLSIAQNLDWDTSEFTLLLIDFSTSLDLIPKINYLKAITKIKSFLKQWQYRNLTPIGKISLIKSTILSKFVHLFTSIPTKKLYLDQINEIVYNFLWDQKPDKIKRKVICANYMQGGLRMINIYNFVKGLKVSWIRRLINNMNDNSQWSELFNGFYGKSDNFTTLGGEWGEWFFKKRQITNEFWLEVLNSWKQLCRVQEPKSNIEINSSCL